MNAEISRRALVFIFSLALPSLAAFSGAAARASADAKTERWVKFSIIGSEAAQREKAGRHRYFFSKTDVTVTEGKLSLYKDPQGTPSRSYIRVAGGKALSTEGLGQLLREEISRGSEGLLERIYGSAVAMNTEVAINDDALMVSVQRKD